MLVDWQARWRIRDKYRQEVMNRAPAAEERPTYYSRHFSWIVATAIGPRSAEQSPFVSITENVDS
jgi:hypothetical protein